MEEAIRLYRGELKLKQVAKLIAEKTAEITKHKYFREAMTKRFKSSGFYSWREIRYFLFEYNLHLQERSKTDRKKLDWLVLNERKADYRTVEHIFPQNARAKYWTERFSGLKPAQRKSLINSLGNLLPLSHPKNSSLSNKPFPEKVSGTKDEVIGFQYGCYAENEVASVKSWTKEAILERGLKLLSFMEKRWGLDLGSRKEKIELLGLDFLKK